MAAMSSKDHALVIFAAIIPDRIDRLDKALRVLTTDHFTDRTHAILFGFMSNFLNNYNSIIPLKALETIAAKYDQSRELAYKELYVTASETEIDDASFDFSIDQLQELAAIRETSNAFTESVEILTRGKEVSKGVFLKGHRDARARFLAKSAEIDRNLTIQEAPEGNIRHEGDSIIEAYAERKRKRLAGLTGGCDFGIPALDSKIEGMQPGELCLVIGYTSDGKTSLCTQATWHAVTQQGLNVAYITAENTKAEIEYKIFARHSKLSQFELANGLNAKDIEKARLTDFETKKFQDIVYDFTKNPNYGNFWIAQAHKGITVSSLEGMLMRLQREFKLDLVVADYLGLWTPERKYNAKHEEAGSVVQAAKQLAVTFDNGRGIPLVSPWQVSREAKDKADKDGYYTLRSLSDTTNAERSSDIIISTLIPQKAYDDRFGNMKAQLLKNRNGLTSAIIDLQVDYATATFTAVEKQGSMTGLLGTPGVNE